MKLSFREALKSGILIGDGALGTYLYQLGFPVGISYEELNLTRPEVILDVHRRYVEAGATLIETNTYTATADKLLKFGLEAEVEAINRAAVQLARQAAGDKAYVAGVVGSIRAAKRRSLPADFVRAQFVQQIDILIDEKVDVILLETFFEYAEICIALDYIRSVSDIPVICQFAIDESGQTLDGVLVAEAFDKLTAKGADVVGLNCRTGPLGLTKLMQTLQDVRPTPMSVFPNAGTADFVDGTYSYTATPEYFGQSARTFATLGAHIIGGCCGTTPEHVASIARALKGFNPATAADVSLLTSVSSSNESTTTSTPIQHAENEGQPSLVELVKERHVVIVELDPPRDLTIERFMKGAEALHQAGADAVTLADNSLAVTRMSNMALGALMKERHGIRPLIHIACRDRNLIGTQSHMMGLDALGIDHVLAVTGDPAKFGDLPGSSSVYDVSSFDMIRMIKKMNEGISFSGKAFKQPSRFVVGAAFNPNVKHLDKAIQRLEKKVEAGADYIMTQPVYDVALIREIAEKTKHISVPIFIGIMPLASGRNAEYLHNEVPGIQLSDAVRAEMAGLEGEEGRAAGTKIAKALIDEAVKHFNGIYLITPFLFYEMSVELTQYVHEITID
jgi:homocysteine S-methyltransferase